jgi:hypothetical protein
MVMKTYSLTKLRFGFFLLSLHCVAIFENPPHSLGLRRTSAKYPSMVVRDLLSVIRSILYSLNDPNLLYFCGRNAT